MENACEVAHYACLNNIPVRKDYIEAIAPVLDLDIVPIVDDNNFEEVIKEMETFEEKLGLFGDEDIRTVNCSKRTNVYRTNLGRENKAMKTNKRQYREYKQNLNK